MVERSRQRGSRAQRPRTTRPRREMHDQSGSGTTGNLVGLAGAVGLALLGYHGREFDVQQTAYASRQDCLDDWGTEQSCQPVSTGSAHGPVYFGPRYYWDPGRGRPVVIGADGSERVATAARVGPSGSHFGSTSFAGTFARGGFGGIGRGLGSGHGG
jgi:hypothetical protein